MKAHYYCFSFWGKNPILFKKNFKFFCKKCIFWRQIFLENFVSCQYISLTLATLKWNDRIPSICFSIKIRFFKIKLWWKWKKKYWKTFRKRDPIYAQISMKVKTSYFSMSLQQQKTCVLGEPMPNYL